jgi:uncharacterized protein
MLVLLTCMNIFCVCAAASPYKGILWRVTSENKNNIKQDVYLWGVSHEIAIDSKYQTTKKINDIFIKNNLYITESNFSQKSSPTKDTFSKSILLPKGITLRDVLTEEAFAGFQTHFKTLGFPDEVIDEFSKLRPEVLFYASYFGSSEEQKKTRYKKGYDEIFGRQQIENKKGISYLENLEEILSIFEDACPSKSDASALLMDKFDSKIDTIETGYWTNLMRLVAEGNLQELNAVTLKMQAEIKSQEVYYRCSIVPRNKLWAQKIKALKTTDMPVMISVGAAHLLGEGSLIELLKKDGYKVEFIEQEE